MHACVSSTCECLSRETRDVVIVCKVHCDEWWRTWFNIEWDWYWEWKWAPLRKKGLQAWRNCGTEWNGTSEHTRLRLEQRSLTWCIMTVWLNESAKVGAVYDFAGRKAFLLQHSLYSVVEIKRGVCWGDRHCRVSVESMTEQERAGVSCALLSRLPL